MGTHEDAEKGLMRRAKKAGITKAEACAARQLVLTTQARREGWRPSELAMSLADVFEAADDVWNETEEPARGGRNNRGPKGPKSNRRRTPLPEGQR